MPRPRLLVFDLDGTLIDSSTDLCNCINAALTHVGRPPLPPAILTSYIGDGAAMLVRRALGDPATLDYRDPANAEQQLTFKLAFQHFLTYYREHLLDNTRVYPGVMESLRALRAADPALPMAVLTNKPVGPSQRICKALGLEPYFFANYGGNSFATKKPDPAGLRTLIAEASALPSVFHPITPAETVMIGDSDVDIRTARACGARSLGCTYGLAPEALASSVPDQTVDQAADWPQALGF